MVIEDDGRVIGFFADIGQQLHRWVDDLWLAEPDGWDEAIALITDIITPPWVTCVSTADHDRRRAMEVAGLSVVSSYFARQSVAATFEPEPDPGPASGSVEPSDPVPAHTFGGRPFDPAQPGALHVTDGDGGLLVGSPSVAPPIYDPGGPSCVIDRVTGPDRAGLLDRGLAAAAARGDHQVIVVSGSQDPELESMLADRGFRREVLLYRTRSVP